MGSEIWLGIMGAIASLWAADSLGRFVHKGRTSILSFGTGWMLLALWGWALALAHLWRPWPLMITILSLCVMGLIQRWREIIAILKKISPSDVPRHWKWCYGLAFLLLAVRICRGLLPIENWDSVNQHLPLLLERLQYGNLEAILNVSTDRRTFLGGILLKGYPMAFDPTGRALILTHFGIVFWGLLCIAQQLKLRFNEVVDLPYLWIFMWLSLSDLWIYIGMAGDEPWFCLLALVWIEFLLNPSTQKSNRHATLMACLQTLALSIKATALFFLCPIGLAGVFIFCRQWKGLVLGLILGISVLAATGAWSRQHYNMIYPLQRWSNLLATHEPTPMFSAQDVSAARERLGLADHRDNHSALNAPWQKLVDNISRGLQWPLGPYVLWCVILIVGAKQKKSSKPTLTLAALLLGSTLIGLAFAMASWSFSTQAITRYCLPLWAWLLLSIALILSQYPHYMAWFRHLLLLMLGLAFLLELKAFVGQAQGTPWWNAQATWEQKLADGPLLEKWKKVNPRGEKTFYIGGAAVLLSGQGHWLAQIGNEVGWREPAELPNFLKITQIKWWVLANSAERFDPVYGALTQKALEAGLLKIVEECPQGKIYSVLKP